MVQLGPVAAPTAKPTAKPTTHAFGSKTNRDIIKSIRDGIFNQSAANLLNGSKYEVEFHKLIQSEKYLQELMHETAKVKKRIKKSKQRLRGALDVES